MKRPLLLLLASMAAGGLALAASGPKAGGEALYVGEYSLDQGGTDAAGGVHLLLFPGGDYAIVYFGGMQQGTWKVMPNGEIELHEWPTDPADFVIFGRHTPELGTEVRLHFKGFEESYAKIGLAETNQFPGAISLHPAFNDDANCYASSYTIRRPAGKLAALHLAAYQEPTRAKYEQVKFSKKLLYSFPIDKRYNDYQVLYRAEASKPAVAYVGRLVKNELTLYPVATAHLQGVRGDSYGERSEISDTDMQEMKPLLKAVRKPLPAQLKIKSDSDGADLTYVRLKGNSQPLQESAVKLLEPLFIARCE